MSCWDGDGFVYHWKDTKYCRSYNNVYLQDCCGQGLGSLYCGQGLGSLYKSGIGISIIIVYCTFCAFVVRDAA